MIGATTIPEALLATAAGSRGEYVFHLDEDEARLSVAELLERADRGARRLAALGVQPGDAVGLLGPNRPEWVVAAFSVWLAGAALVPMQIPIRIRDPGAFAAGLRNVCEAARVRAMLTAPGFARFSPVEDTVAWDQRGDASAAELPLPEPDGVAVIQFTSGSTAAPRGAMLCHRAVMAQMDVLDELVATGAENRISISWTPFFHDLGLFLNVLPSAVWGLRSHHLPTDLFARDPSRWLRLAATTRATLTLAPSAAFGSALRALARRRERLDLGALEAVRFAAEGVDPAVLERVVEAAPQLNLRPEALGSSYGLAEAVLAVSYTTPGEGLALDRISLELLAAEGTATPVDRGPARLLVGCGRPKMDLRIVGSEGELGERQVGEIQVRGPSTTSGYVGAEAPEPFDGDWLRTGDLGYMVDGQLYVTGRAKDVVIAMGHNYFPEDFEWAAGRVDGVRPGRCVAFSRPEEEAIVILVEARANGSAPSLAREVRRAVGDAIGIRPSEVVVLPAGSVQKTTSGKLRRAAMRDAYLSGTLAPPTTD